MTPDQSSAESGVVGKTIRVFSRPGCHLCEELIEQLMPIIRGIAEIDVVNIDDDADLQQRYGTRIPVVEIDGNPVCEYFLDQAAIFAALSD